MSPVGEILVERSVIGWKEFELEVMRDLKDNVVIVCPIENFDPMGIHRRQYYRCAGHDTDGQRISGHAGCGGPNHSRNRGRYRRVQYSIRHRSQKREMVIIEMNPRVSRSSALASKACNFPSQKSLRSWRSDITLDEITIDISASPRRRSSRPSITWSSRCRGSPSEISRRRFHTHDSNEVGRRAMAIGRTFKEALHKVIRSLKWTAMDWLPCMVSTMPVRHRTNRKRSEPRS